MNTFKKTSLALALALSTSFALAAEVAIDLTGVNVDADLGPGGDSDYVTGPITGFTTNGNGDAGIPVTSVYYDIDGTPGINTGDYVIDIMEDLAVASLSGNDSGISNTHYYEYQGLDLGLAVGWDMNVDWNLQGIVGVTDLGGGVSVYQADYSLTGMSYLDIDITSNSGGVDIDNAAVFSVVGQSALPADNSQLNLTLQLFSVVSGVFFDSQGVDYAELLNLYNTDMGAPVTWFARTDIEGQTVAPTLSGTASFANQTVDTYTRTANIGSVDFGPVDVPAPLGLSLFALGLLGLGASARLRKSA